MNFKSLSAGPRAEAVQPGPGISKIQYRLRFLLLSLQVGMSFLMMGLRSFYPSGH